MVSFIVAVRDGSVEWQADKSSKPQRDEEEKSFSMTIIDRLAASGVGFQAAKLPNEEAKPHHG